MLMPIIMGFIVQNIREKTDLGFLKLLVTDAVLSEIITQWPSGYKGVGVNATNTLIYFIKKGDDAL